MTVSMIDSLAGMRRLATARPDEWDASVRDMWAPMAGMFFFLPEEPDWVQVHAQSFGFGRETRPDVVMDALDALETADAWGRIERALQDGLERLAAANPAMTMPDVKVILVLGDPDNPHFMDEIRGLAAFGGISGYISITVWPTDEVLNRLEAIALHELHHNVRYTRGGVVWDPRTVTVGEQIVAEGLADLFAVESCGEVGYTHFVSDQTRTSDAVLARVVEGLGVTGMHNFGAWVLGDASATQFGGTPVGVPTGAGYAVGARLVSTYLWVTGRTAAESVAVPSADVLAIALPELGLATSEQ